MNKENNHYEKAYILLLRMIKAMNIYLKRKRSLYYQNNSCGVEPQLGQIFLKQMKNE
jgi:hypothetical protein